MAGVLLAGGVAAVAEQILPAATAFVGNAASGIGMDGGGAAGGSSRRLLTADSDADVWLHRGQHWHAQAGTPSPI